MSKLRAQIAISLDGFVAGPSQSIENPLGEGGTKLHDWAFSLAAFREPHGEAGGEVNASTAVVEERLAGVGAEIMGRNKFGGHPGPWDEAEPWQGWWGEDPPFHMPVFVLTHHAREPLVKGDTTFTFVTGIVAALERAREAAGVSDVAVGGGANAIQQYLAAGLLDELELDLVPVLLGGGSRLFENLGDEPPELELSRVVDAPGVTHLKYRVLR
jgi:dihydrofolate reductase